MKGKLVRIKQPGISETIFGKPRKIIVPDDCMLVEFRQRSMNKVWLEVWKQPEDGRLRHEGLKQTILLDGKLSDNGGRFVTIDADLGVQVGYQIGQMAHPIPAGVEEVESDGQVLSRKLQRLEVLETREWVGIDGVTTWLNEQDLSFKQIALANIQDWLKLIKNMMTLTGIALIIVAIALVICSIVIGQAYHVKLPGVK